jgi:hypothetical protein
MRPILCAANFSHLVNHRLADVGQIGALAVSSSSFRIGGTRAGSLGIGTAGDGLAVDRR